MIHRVLNRLRFIRWKCNTYIYRLLPKINIDKSTVIEDGVVLRSQYGGSISIGRNCYLSKGCQCLTHGGDIFIGNNCTINPYSIIYGQGGVKIGDGVRIAAHCVVVPSNHIFDDINTFIISVH